jgi:hypothetical protein
MAVHPSLLPGIYPIPPSYDNRSDSTPRFLLGFLQGGFVPDTVLYLSYFYTKSERK